MRHPSASTPSSDRLETTSPSPAVAKNSEIPTATRPDASIPAQAPARSLPAESFRANVIELSQSGDVEGAQQVLNQGLQAHPDDPVLVGLKALTEQRQASKITSSRLQQLVQPFMGEAADPGSLAGDADQTSVSAAAAIPIGLSAGRGPPPALTARPEPGKNTPAVRNALTQLKVGDFSRAEADLAAHLEQHPGDWYARSLRALALRQQKRYKEASRQAQAAVDLNPFDAEARKINGLVYSDLGLYEESAREYGRALAIKPKDATALAQRGLALRRIGREEEGLADLKAAVALDASLAGLYEEAVRTKAPPSRRRTRSHAAALMGAVLGLALLMGAIHLWGVSGKTARAQRPAMRQADRLCAGYELLRRIGEGGMGTVYEALDTALQRRVAVKRMRSEIAGDVRERRRFLKEARTVASLKHPNIIEIHSVVEHEDDLFLVFEFLEGRSLDDILRERRRLTPAEALALSKPIARALDYAHAQGVIHQDLKPGNVMVADKTVKVMDFGIARRVLESLSTRSVGEIVGTPAYMAPEQEQGGCSPASDVYALGVCLYEMLSGSRPYDGVGAYLRKMQKQYPPLRAVAPHLPEGLELAVDKALSPAPERRHATASELVADLESRLGAGAAAA